MKLDGTLNIWGKGQLIAFSGLDGATDYNDGLVLRTATDATLEIMIPENGGTLRFPEKSTGCFLASDVFRIGTATGVMIDCHHLLIAGEFQADRLSPALTVQRGGGRVLIGATAHFNPALLECDISGEFETRQRYFTDLPDFGATAPAQRKTLAKAYSQLKGQICSPEGAIGHLWSTPDRWPHRAMWLWDSVFHALGLRHINPAAATEILLAVLDRQQPDGMVPHMNSPTAHSDITQPPILAWGLSQVLDRAPEKVVFDRLVRYIEWIFGHRDSDGNGLVEWAIEGNPGCRSGESGMDNSSRFDQAIQLDAPDFNAYLSLECETLSRFAHALNLPEQATRWHDRHEQLNLLINRYLWNEESGIYMDFDVKAKQHTHIAASSGFLPLLCGAPTPAMAEKLRANLNNPETFRTALRVPSISRKCGAHYAKDMWRGPVWININYLISLGLDRYGYYDDARELRQETMEAEERFYLQYGTFFEFYDDRDETAPPELLRKGKCDPASPYHQSFHDYGWSATLYIDMLQRA